jgi:uncharacterized Zn finger protein (UPF0148 family)
LKCPECGTYQYRKNGKNMRCPKCKSRMVSLYAFQHAREKELKRVRAAQNLSRQLSQKKYHQRNGEMDG